jgi:hypothetical protein
MLFQQWQQVEGSPFQHRPPTKVEDLPDQLGGVPGPLVDHRHPFPIALR